MKRGLKLRDPSRCRRRSRGPAVTTPDEEGTETEMRMGVCCWQSGDPQSPPPMKRGLKHYRSLHTCTKAKYVPQSPPPMKRGLKRPLAEGRGMRPPARSHHPR